jgi:hypothetical protein
VSQSARILPRFDGAEAWFELASDQQAELGAVTLEYVVATPEA